MKHCWRRRCLHEQPKWIMHNSLSWLRCTKQTTTNKTHIRLDHNFLSCPRNHGCNKSGDSKPWNTNQILYIHTCAELSTNTHHRCLLGCLFLPLVASTLRAHQARTKQSVLPKKHSIHCVQEAKIKTQSCRRAFPGLSDLVWITLQWENTAKWSYSVYKKR